MGYMVIIGIWAIITAFFYFSAKYLLNSLAESQYIDALSSPFLRLGKARRKPKQPEFILFFVGLGFSLLLGFSAILLLTALERFLFTPSEGVFLKQEFIGYWLIGVILGFGFTALLMLLYFKQSVFTKKENWTYLPSFSEVQRSVIFLKQVSFATALFLLILLLINMKSHVAIDEKYILIQPELFQESYPFKTLKKVKVGTETVLRTKYRSVVTEKVVEPRCYLFFGQKDSVNIWQNTFNSGTADLLNMVVWLGKKGIPVEIHPLGIMDKALLKKRLTHAKQEEIVQFFDRLEAALKGIDKPFEIGQTVEMDSVLIRLDSVKEETNFGIFASDNTPYLYLYFTIHNKQKDRSFYFGTLYNTFLVTKNGKQFTQSFNAKSIGKSEILPVQKTSVGLPFEVSRAAASHVVYKVSPFNEQKVIFNLIPDEIKGGLIQK